jgi:hypothetical protein
MTLLTTPDSTRFRIGPRSIAAVILAFSLVTVGLVPSQSHAAKAKTKVTKEANDPREMQAREAYAAGSYKDALDIYTKLYAEKLHPTYLRNIGRCYQNLGQPDRAISSFREYLRKAKDMPADERAEVEGYIKEMEDLQKKDDAASASTPLPAVPPVQPVTPPPQPVVVVQPPPPVPAPATTPPFYKRAWFWGVVGGVVVAGAAAGLWAGGVFSSKSNNECQAGVTCISGTSP